MIKIEILDVQNLPKKVLEETASYLMAMSKLKDDTSAPVAVEESAPVAVEESAHYINCATPIDEPPVAVEESATPPPPVAVEESAPVAVEESAPVAVEESATLPPPVAAADLTFTSVMIELTTLVSQGVIDSTDIKALAARVGIEKMADLMTRPDLLAVVNLEIEKLRGRKK